MKQNLISLDSPFLDEALVDASPGPVSIPLPVSPIVGFPLSPLPNSDGLALSEPSPGIGELWTAYGEGRTARGWSDGEIEEVVRGLQGLGMEMTVGAADDATFVGECSDPIVPQEFGIFTLG